LKRTGYAGNSLQSPRVRVDSAVPTPQIVAGLDLGQARGEICQAWLAEVDHGELYETATARVREALEPRKPPAEPKPRPKDARKAWVSAGLQQMRRGV